MNVHTPFRIAGPVSAISLLLFIVGVAGAWYVHLSQRRTSDMLDHNVSSIRAAEELELLIRELRTELNRYLLSDDDSHIRKGLAMKKDIDGWTKEVQRCATADDETSLVKEIKKDSEVFFARLSEFNSRLNDESSKAALQRSTRDLLTNQILVNARKYLDINEKDLERSQADGRMMDKRVALGLLLLGTCGSIAGLLAGYALARGITRELVHLSFPIRDVAGKLNEVVGPITVSAKPGLQDLQSVLVNVAREVGTIVGQLQDSHREMMRADQLAATGQLAAGLAHELRNPLMSIKLIIQAARRDTTGDERLDAMDLRILDEEVTRLESLLQTFLEFAKPATLETRRLNLQGIVEPSLQLLSRRAAIKRVSFSSRVHAGACDVEGDESQLRQVLLNLLLNAIDAAPPGGTVQVDVRPVAPDGAAEGFVELRVADNGSGLASEMRQRIFEPFFSTRETGLGLGLAICKRIVDSHGGEITADNRPGGGAEFVVRLPIANAESRGSDRWGEVGFYSEERIVGDGDVAARR